MAEMANYSMEHQLGCGFLGGIFSRRSFCSSKKSLPTNCGNHDLNNPPTHSAEKVLLGSADVAKPCNRRTSSVPSRLSTSKRTSLGGKPSDAAAAARSSTSSSSTSSGRINGSKIKDDKRKPSEDLTCNSLELSTVVITSNNNYQQTNDGKGLVRATSSSNKMLLSQLGNLKQLRTGNMHGNNNPNAATVKTVDYYMYNNNNNNIQDVTKQRYGESRLGRNVVMGNIVKQPSGGELPHCNKSLINKLDPEELKSMGNEAYHKGRFEDALALYDGAIALDSSNATYRSNKSAALIGLGHLMEALVECKEAIRIDPAYHRAHHRLATIYLRLGEAEKAMHHYKKSGSFVDGEDIEKAEFLQKHLIKSNEAKESKKWNTLLKETQYAISYGADSAPQVYALQAEALLRLQRHQEAYDSYKKSLKKLSIESYTKLFGHAASTYLLMIGAQVYIAAGRFEDAVKAAQEASLLDPNNKEVITVLKRAKAIASARLSGNLLFKASKYLEACNVYSEGLEHDPYNSILLCNRAACRSKLGQYEKAVEDCTTAIIVMPCYSKAKLRRADCNAKLERWEASIQDYEVLIREIPGDEEVGRSLFEAQVQLKKQGGEDVKDMKFGSNLNFIAKNERFRHFVTSPGMAVVLFCNKGKHKQVLQLMEQVCKRFPSVNFLKVEVEDHPYIAKSEGVSTIPAFKIYKNGSGVKEIPGNKCELLEKSVRLYSS